MQEESKTQLPYDTNILPTDQKLKDDAVALVNQYLQFWLPGEVEIVVILSRPGAQKAAIATSVTNGPRVQHLLKEAGASVPDLVLLARANRKVR